MPYRPFLIELLSTTGMIRQDLAIEGQTPGFMRYVT